MSDRQFSSGAPPAGGEGHGAGSGGDVADNHEDVVDQVMDEAVSEANDAVEDDEESVELVSSDEPLEMDEDAFLRLKRNDPKLTELQIQIATDSFAIDIDWDEEEECLQRNTHLKKLDVWTMESSFEEEPHEVRARELLTSKVCRAIGRNRTIRHLCVVGDYDWHSFIDVEALRPFLEGNGKLRRISISECKLDRAQTHQIISSLKNRRSKGTLRCIDLGSNTFEDGDEDDFEEAFTEELIGVLAAGGYCNLRELGVLDRLGLGGYIMLSRFMTQPQCKLKKLRFKASDEFGDEHMGILVNAIAGNNSLKEILFDGASLVSAQVWRSFSAAFVGSGIESLSLFHNRICPEKANIIGEMMSNSKTLRNLNVMESMADECWTSVFRAFEGPSLEELYISHCNVGEEGMADLGERMSKNASLKVLNADRMKGTTPRVWQCFFRNMGDAGKLPLQELDLGDSNVGDDGAVALSTAFASKNSCLRTLILSGNNISCSGARALSAMLANNTAFEHLRMDRNDIGDEGATAISLACASSSTLKRLDLWCDQITSNGRRSFFAVLQNPITSLENLLLGGDAPSFEEIMGFLAILATDTTLKELQFHYDTEQQRDERVLEALRNVLCDKSSVRATFTSNHTLGCLWGVTGYYPLPGDIEAYLSMNKDGNKKFLVARQKILQTHFSEGDGWVRIFTDMQLAVLPEAIHWLALDEAGHSLLFQLLRSLPALTGCHRAKTKRAPGTKRKLGS